MASKLFTYKGRHFSPPHYSETVQEEISKIMELEEELRRRGLVWFPPQDEQPEPQGQK